MLQGQLEEQKKPRHKESEHTYSAQKALADCAANCTCPISHCSCNVQGQAQSEVTPAHLPAPRSTALVETGSSQLESGSTDHSVTQAVPLGVQDV